MNSGLPFPIGIFDDIENFNLSPIKNIISDNSQTLKRLDKIYYLTEPDVIKNIDTICKEFKVIRRTDRDKDELIVDLKPTGGSEVALVVAKYRLFRCITFLNRMIIFYDDDSSAQTWFTIQDKKDENIVDKPIMPFSITYNKTGEKYEFVVINDADKFYLSDQGRTYRMLDMVFDLREPDVQRKLNQIMDKCDVRQIGRSFVKEMVGWENATDVDKEKMKNKAMHQLLECVSFMDTMRIFYV